MTDPEFDNMIEPLDFPKLGNIVNNPKLSFEERTNKLKEFVKPEGGYKKRIVERHIEMYYGEEFTLCLI